MIKPQYESLSYVGRRSSNQDNVLAAQYNEKLWFFVVADGMGGAEGGDKASEIVVETAASILNEWSANEEIKPDQLKEILKQVYSQGQKNLEEYVAKNPDLKGMGTTCTSLLVYEDKYVFGNIGDSRLYHLKDKSIKPITQDHSAIKDYEKKYGQDIPEEILNKYGHILTKTMDGGSDQPDIYPFDKDFEVIEKGDLFLICSDGLLLEKNPLNDEFDNYFNHYISATKDLRKAAENLVSFAFHQGSSDNISVVLAEFGHYKRLNTDLNNLAFPPSENDQPVSEEVHENDDSLAETTDSSDGTMKDTVSSGRKKGTGIVLSVLSFILVFLVLLATNIISINLGVFKQIEINDTINQEKGGEGAIPEDTLKQKDDSTKQFNSKDFDNESTNNTDNPQQKATNKKKVKENKTTTKPGNEQQSSEGKTEKDDNKQDKGDSKDLKNDSIKQEGDRGVANPKDTSNQDDSTNQSNSGNEKKPGIETPDSLLYDKE